MNIYIEKVRRDAGVDTFFEAINQLAKSVLGEADWDRLSELFSSQKYCLMKVLERKSLCLFGCPGYHIALWILKD